MLKRSLSFLKKKYVQYYLWRKICIYIYLLILVLHYHIISLNFDSIRSCNNRWRLITTECGVDYNRNEFMEMKLSEQLANKKYLSWIWILKLRV